MDRSTELGATSRTTNIHQQSIWPLQVQGDPLSCRGVKKGQQIKCSAERNQCDKKSGVEIMKCTVTVKTATDQLS